MYTFSMTTVFAFFIFQAILFEITTGECPIECSQCKEMKDGPYMGRWNLKERNSTHCPTPNNGNVCLYRNVNNGTWMCFCDPGAFAYRESCGDITSTTPPTTPATSTTINAIDETTKASTAITTTTTPPSPTESTAISTVNTTTTTTITTTTTTTTTITTTTTTTTPTTTTSAAKFAITTTKNISIITTTATTTTTITPTTTIITTTLTTIPTTSTTTTITIASSTITPTTITTPTTSTTSTTQTKNTILTSDSIYFIAGGYRAWRDIELYHPEKADLSCSMSPPPLNNDWYEHTTFYYNNTIHLYGGRYGTASTCISYSTNTEEWKTHTLSTPRLYGHSSTILNKVVYIIGGVDTSYNYVGVVISTPLPLTDRPVLTPVPNLDYKGQGQCTTKVDEDSLVVTGGAYNGYLSSVIEYNAKDHTTTALPSMKQQRSYHGCAVLEMDNTKWIIVAGGYNSADGNLETTEMLQMGQNAWKPLGNLNVARWGHSIAVTQRGVMAMGGRGGSGSLSSVELLDWSAKTWRIVQPSLSKSRYHFGGEVEIPASMFDCRG